MKSTKSIARIAMALVAGLAIMGFANAQAVKPTAKQEPVFEGTLDEFVGLLKEKGSNSYRQSNAGRSVVLKSHFGSASINEIPSFSKNKKPTQSGLIVLNGKPTEGGLTSLRSIQCKTNDFSLIYKIESYPRDKEIRVLGIIQAPSPHVSGDFIELDSCKVL